jgi:hypothetical protein
MRSRQATWRAAQIKSVIPPRVIMTARHPILLDRVQHGTWPVLHAGRPVPQE